MFACTRFLLAFSSSAWPLPDRALACDTLWPLRRPSPLSQVARELVSSKPGAILLLTDTAAGGIAADLDLLYPGRVKCVSFVEEKVTAELLDGFGYVITVVGDGANLAKLDYGEITAFARRGGQVMSSLFEYAHARNLQFSKTHVLDRLRPAMRIDVACDITRGFAAGDQVWWFGNVSSAPDSLYGNQMYQRQSWACASRTSVRILATSNVNHGAVMVEEKVGKGRIVALDLLSPGRPFFNSYGSTNKYLFLGNMVNQAVRYGKQYPKRLTYDEFVAAMHQLAAKHSALPCGPRGRAATAGRCTRSASATPPTPRCTSAARCTGGSGRTPTACCGWPSCSPRIRGSRASTRPGCTSRSCPSRTRGATTTSPARTPAAWT